MSTDYTFRYDICAHCGQHKETPIGTWAGGSFHWLPPPDNLTDAEKWEAFFHHHQGKVIDEYGKEYSIDEFLLKCVK